VGGGENVAFGRFVGVGATFTTHTVENVALVEVGRGRATFSRSGPQTSQSCGSLVFVRRFVGYRR
jgi:hypothetical protein